MHDSFFSSHNHDLGHWDDHLSNFMRPVQWVNIPNAKEGMFLRECMPMHSPFFHEQAQTQPFNTTHLVKSNWFNLNKNKTKSKPNLAPCALTSIRRMKQRKDEWKENAEESGEKSVKRAYTWVKVQKRNLPLGPNPCRKN